MYLLSRLSSSDKYLHRTFWKSGRIKELANNSTMVIYSGVIEGSLLKRNTNCNIFQSWNYYSTQISYFDGLNNVETYFQYLLTRIYDLQNKYTLHFFYASFMLTNSPVLHTFEKLLLYSIYSTFIYCEKLSLS